MLYILLAKLLDPVVVVLGLAFGRLIPSRVLAASLAGLLAIGGEWLVSGGDIVPGPVLLGLISAALWTALGITWRAKVTAKRSKAQDLV